uniref:Uncharacterized protein n=1 Tax=Panagrolaimus davidi TaxID=227884 RepID=A0A914QNA5_9BILA
MFNDHRIRKAIFRAILRLRYKRSEKFREFPPNNLEKWSIIIVSNSLRSNFTGMLSQDWKGKKSFDQLGAIVQNRRKFLVQMTINLAKKEQQEKLPKLIHHREESTGNDITCLTDIQEEEHSELLSEHRAHEQHDYEAIQKGNKWNTWKANI